MGRGGGGGGGRSHGGGGRSHGGRSFGSSSSRSRGGSRTRSSAHTYHSSGPSHYHGPRVYHRHYYGGGGGTVIGGILGSIILIIVLIAFISLLWIALSANTGSRSAGVSKSTVNREKIMPPQAFDRDCVLDGLGWLYSAAETKKGMEQFYKMTGVQPYLYISDNVNGSKHPGSMELEQFSDEIYDELAQGNESCILLMFFEWYDSDVTTYYTAGRAAQAVMDDEACDILCDYAESLYTSDLDDDGYFSEIWKRTGSRIMEVTPTMASRIPMILCAVLALAAIIGGVTALKLKYKREKERAAETERIMNTPIDRL